MRAQSQLAAGVVVFLVGMSTASAQPKDAAAAETLFLEGRTAMARGNLATACLRFEESIRLGPAPGTWLNLAECEQRSGKLASAWQHLRRGLDALPSDDERVAYTRKKIAELEPRVPKLTIRFAGGLPAGTRVRRDEVELGAGSLGIALPVDPGVHVVEVTDAGGATRSYSVAIAEGERRT